MIRIYLPDDFPEKVTPMFDKLAHKVWVRLGSNSIRYKRNGVRSSFKSEEEIKNFLLDPDFQSYKFPKTFWDQIGLLDDRCCLSNLQPTQSKQPSKSVKVLHERYPASSYQTEYQQLAQQAQLLGKSGKTATVAMLKGTKFFKNRAPSVFLRTVFDYTTFLSSSPDRHRILDAMDLTVCPYCNMNYIFTYNIDGKRQSTADLDHFYPKSIYPEYALCLYNMIPACSVCNSRLKLDQERRKDTHVYPFEDSFAGKLSFRLIHTGKDDPDAPAAGDALVPEFSQALAAPVSSRASAEKEKITNSMQVFKTREIYEQQLDYALELAEKVQIYNDAFSTELKEDYPLLLDQTTVQNLVFGKPESEEEYAGRSLGKLRMDLLRQFHIFK